MRIKIGVVLAFLCMNMYAQRFCYIDSEYILDQVPAYTQAQQKLQSQTEQWRQEVQKEQDELDLFITEFENEKVLLTKEQVDQKLEEIEEMQKAIQQLQEKRFGPDGDVIRTRRTLIRPIQDQVFYATQKVAQKLNYAFVFDKGRDLIMIYTDPKFDISDQVLDELLGRKPSDRRRGSSNNRSNRGRRSSN